MKYKLINKTTNETHVCDKVIIDGFDYYVKEDLVKEDEFFLMGNQIIQNSSLLTDEWCKSKQPKVIACNYLSTDIPKVIDELEIYEYSNSLSKLLYDEERHRDSSIKDLFIVACQSGFNLSKESNPFSEYDMLKFAVFVGNYYADIHNKVVSTKELLEIWKSSHQIKTLYYE